MIRNLRESDYDELFRLYRAQTRDLPFHHSVRRDQFRRDLLTTRFLRRPDDHHPKARIALVATRKNRVCSFVSGGMVTRGDEVVEAKTGYIQAIIGEPGAADLIRDMIGRVVRHVRRNRPAKIVAQDGCLSPVFFADSASTLPSQNAWIGQTLIDSGFSVCGGSVRMVALLDRPRRPVKPTGKLKFYHCKHEMSGFDPRYDFGCVLLKPPHQYGDGVVWCGNFFSGTFVKGTAFRSVYINWFTVLDKDYRGKGLGRLTLQHCLHEAQKKGARWASLLTYDNNFPAQNLYLSEGFKVVDMTHAFELKKRNR